MNGIKKNQSIDGKHMCFSQQLCYAYFAKACSAILLIILLVNFSSGIFEPELDLVL